LSPFVKAARIMVKFASASSLVHRSDVAREFDVHPRTITRWEADAALGFPKSTVIREQRYFKRDEIDAWKESLFHEGLQVAITDRRKRAAAEAASQPCDSAVA
jgi:hypothetical protein